VLLIYIFPAPVFSMFSARQVMSTTNGFLVLVCQRKNNKLNRGESSRCDKSSDRCKHANKIIIGNKAKNDAGFFTQIVLLHGERSP
jgi:hypothetical protein